MSNCYSLISCDGSCPNIHNIQGEDAIILQPYLDQAVYINGNTDCVYIVRDSFLAWHVIDNALFLCNSTPNEDFLVDYSIVNYQVTSIIYNGIQYVNGPPIPYSVTIGTFDCLECIKAVCSTAFYPAANSTNAHSNPLNSIFTSLGLPVQAIPFEKGLAYRLYDGDTFSITIERISQPLFGIEYGLTVDVNTNTVNATLSGADITGDYFGYEDVDTCQTETSSITITSVTPALCQCYLLTDCENIREPIITRVNLSAYLGLVIKLSYCPDVCWSVSTIQNCQGAVENLEGSISAFLNCDSCNPPAPEKEIIVKPRFVKPGYNTKGCSPEYVEKIYCSHAEALYQEIISKRYGIKSCCEIDIQKYQIKKELVDLKMIYDPSVCEIPRNRCCPPCGVSAMLTVADYRSCPSPSNVIAELDF